MIDPHVHFRDFNESYKETLSHGLSVAYKAGLDGVFEMPNTDPPMIYREMIEKRIELADSAHVPIFHGIYGGLTSDEIQIKVIVETYNALFPRVVGLKLFAGPSTGKLAVNSIDEQKLVFESLVSIGYKGVVSVHCEKISLFKIKFNNEDDPFSHTLVRTPESEIESIIDIISIAEEKKFKGTLHICHISVPESVSIVNEARKRKTIKITCGVTPHHALLWDELMKKESGYLLKMNPPLRPKESQEKILDLLVAGEIDWIETDHAPHLKKEKKQASGIPVLPFYPHFLREIKKMGISDSDLNALTHDNIVRTFHINIPNTKRTPDYSLQSEYEFDPFIFLQ